MPHRRKRRSRRSSLGTKGRAWFVGIAALMLVLIVCMIVPPAHRQNISVAEAFGLALLMWGISVFAFWACLRSRRRRYKHGHVHYHDYTEENEQ